MHFQNVEMMANKIMARHHLDKKQRPFATRQASQIRHCLLQAREYFTASQSVSIATRPVLLYYATMSLALCEVLFKQDGDSRLEKLRERHNCHGLQLKLASDIPTSMSLKELGAAIGAKPQMGDTGPRGTFEAWHQTSAEPPLVGWREVTYPSSQSKASAFSVLMDGDDTRPAPLPRSGVSLLDCLIRLPRMSSILGYYGIASELVRATCSAHLTANTSADSFMSGYLEIITHPSTPLTFEEFGRFCRFSASTIPQLEVIELPENSARFRITYSRTSGDVQLPWSIADSTDMTWFSTRKEFLNEFGLYYVCLHILGNVARYYPDKWLAHIEQHTALAVISESLLDIASERLPLLLLSELHEECLVVEH